MPIDEAMRVEIDLSGSADIVAEPDLHARVGRALLAMKALERGAIANETEGRMVGHYWLRDPSIAPTADIESAIRSAIVDVESFARLIRAGEIRGADGPFERVVHIGIGGSTLGPQFVASALNRQRGIEFVFLDNADPHSLELVLRDGKTRLGRTLVSVVSKSGVTPTPEWLWHEVAHEFQAHGIPFPRHAVATTCPGSPLYEKATAQGWLATFPVWDWVGGRTSVTSSVGLLPAALAGLDVPAFLKGAAAMDVRTRRLTIATNPSAALAAIWFSLATSEQCRLIAVLPYSDRLALFPRYLQQLMMESLGKRRTRHGTDVTHAFTVFGGKGSSDQHSYVQQLLDGPDDVFVVIVAVRSPAPTLGGARGEPLSDLLYGYREGFRRTLSARGRRSVTITLPDVSEHSLGALVALFERAVGLYGELIDVNAYDQPAIDKFAAAPILELQVRVLDYLAATVEPASVDVIAHGIGAGDSAELRRVLDHLVFDVPRRLERTWSADGERFTIPAGS